MTEKATMSIAVVSGKGGVGKTNIALNLAYALHRAKQRVLLMDCDLGLANIDVLLGIAPKTPVEQALLGEAAIEDTIVGVEPGGFSLLPASSGIEILKNEGASLLPSFLRQLNAAAKNYDYLILDVGAGITDAVQIFASKVALRLVVVTPEPTSITDAYALIKVLAIQNHVTDFHVLVNQAETPEEEKWTFGRLAGACDKFLGLTLHSLGCVRHDPAMLQAVRRQEPLLKFSSTSPAGKDLVALAVRLHKIRETLPLDRERPLYIEEPCEI